MHGDRLAPHAWGPSCPPCMGTVLPPMLNVYPNAMYIKHNLSLPILYCLTCQRCYLLHTSHRSAITSRHSDYHLYADDAQLYVSFCPSGDEQLNTIDSLCSCLDEIRKWSRASLLKLNDEKSDVVVFGSKHKLNDEKTDVVVFGTKHKLNDEKTDVVVFVTKHKLNDEKTDVVVFGTKHKLNDEKTDVVVYGTKH